MLPSKIQPGSQDPQRVQAEGWWLFPLSVVFFGLGALAPALASFDLSPPPPQSRAKKPAPAAPPQSSPSPQSALVLREVVVTSCTDELGRRQPTCDLPAIRPLVDPVLKQLAECKGAWPLAVGRLSLGLDLDFASGEIRTLRAGASTQLPRQVQKALMACAEASLLGAPLRGVDHEHTQYWVYFLADVALPGAQAELKALLPDPPLKPGDSAASAEPLPLFSGVVRTMRPIRVLSGPAANSRSETVLPRGTLLRVIGRRAGFFRVAYSEGTKQGWAAAADLGL